MRLANEIKEYRVFLTQKQEERKTCDFPETIGECIAYDSGYWDELSR